MEIDETIKFDAMISFSDDIMTIEEMERSINQHRININVQKNIILAKDRVVDIGLIGSEQTFYTLQREQMIL